jgi:hypothetical protein
MLLANSREMESITAEAGPCRFHVAWKSVSNGALALRASKPLESVHAANLVASDPQERIPA